MKKILFLLVLISFILTGCATAPMRKQGVTLNSVTVGEVPYKKISFKALELTSDVAYDHINYMGFPAPFSVDVYKYDGILLEVRNDSNKPFQVLLNESSVVCNGKLTHLESKEPITVPPMSTFSFKVSPEGTHYIKTEGHGTNVFFDLPHINEINLSSSLTLTLAVRSEAQDRKYYVLKVNK